MFIVYVLKSIKTNWFYVGFTKNISIRLNQHNHGQVKSTKNKRPFIVIYTKYFGNRASARDFEKFLKIRYNKEKLIKSLNLLQAGMVELVDTQS